MIDMLKNEEKERTMLIDRLSKLTQMDTLFVDKLLEEIEIREYIPAKQSELDRRRSILKRVLSELPDDYSVTKIDFQEDFEKIWFKRMIEGVTGLKFYAYEECTVYNYCEYCSYGASGLRFGGWVDRGVEKRLIKEWSGERDEIDEQPE